MTLACSVKVYRDVALGQGDVVKVIHPVAI